MSIFVSLLYKYLLYTCICSITVKRVFHVLCAVYKKSIRVYVYECTGVANIGTQLALTTRNMYKWAGDIPLDIFNEYVLPYANVNEV